MVNSNIVFEHCQESDLPKDFKYKFYKEVRQRKVVDRVKLSWNPWSPIKKINKQYYYKRYKVFVPGFGVCYEVDKSEVFEFMPKDKTTGEHMRNRRSLRKIFVDLRQLIATNFIGEESEQFLTLTYEGSKQTNDSKQIHKDFYNFWKRLKRKYKEYDLGYIAIVEPHASGNWHMHVLVKSMSGKSLEFKGKELYDVWQQGYVTVENIVSDHIGAYFIAYFTNMELTTSEDIEKYSKENDIKEKNGKKYIKGKRLDYYPDNMMIYRRSDNIEKPTVTKGIAIGDGYSKTYTSTVKLTTEEGSEMYITTEQFKEIAENENDCSDS